MHVVQLANFYAPTSGGLRSVVDRLGRGYREAGHGCTLVVPGGPGARGVRRTASGWTVPGVPVGGPYRVVVRRRDLVTLLDRLAPDRLEVSDKLSLGWVGSWARERGVPSVLISHERIDAILADRVPARLPLVAAADRWNARLAARFDQVVCTSAFARQEFDRIGVRHVTTIPLGVDLATFRPSPAGPRRGGPVALVTVGRLSREKRPGVAVEVLRHLRAGGLDATLTLVGDGPMHASLRRRARGLPVRFAGHVSDRRELARLVAAADVCLAPCPADTFGMAVLEALACGVPAVVPHVGGPAALVAGGAGVAVPADVEGFAGGVRTVLAWERHGRAAAARRRAEAFPWSRSIRAFLAVHGLDDGAGARVA